MFGDDGLQLSVLESRSSQYSSLHRYSEVILPVVYLCIFGYLLWDLSFAKLDLLQFPVATKQTAKGTWWLDPLLPLQFHFSAGVRKTGISQIPSCT